MTKQRVEAELERLLLGLGSLLRHTRTTGFSSTLESLLRPLFDPQSVIVLVFQHRSRPLTISQWIPDAALRSVFEGSYFDFGYFLDPYYQLAMSDFEDGAYQVRQIAPDRFFRSAYYRRYYRQTRMVDEIGCLARIDHDRVAHLSLGRNQGNRKFRRRDLALLQSLQPLLMQIIIQHCEKRDRLDITKEQQTRPLREQLFYSKLSDEGRISRREAEVASLVVQGHSTTAIGMILEISPQTVKVHRRNLYRKLNISSQAELFGLFIA